MVYQSVNMRGTHYSTWNHQGHLLKNLCPLKKEGMVEVEEAKAPLVRDVVDAHGGDMAKNNLE